MSTGSKTQEYYLVLVSASSEVEAMAIAQALVQEKLAACVSLMPIKSIYRWQDQIQEDAEWQLLIKTPQHCFEALKIRVVDLHSYEVPEILAIPIQAGLPLYLSWMGNSVEGRGNA
jgi:periplasmic divalent cation tolerance protein